MSLTPEKKLAAVRTTTLWDHPFFGCLALHLELVEDNTIPTMATDGSRIFWNRDFVNSLKREELLFVFIHEIMHGALMHHVRLQNRDSDRWNIACDFAINGELVACKIGSMPKGGFLSDEFTGMPAEEIYNLLPEEQSGGGGDDRSTDPGGCGGVIQAASASDTGALRMAAAEMTVRLKQAAAIALKAGTMPESMKRLLDMLLEPVVDWRAMLRRFIDESVVKDYSWRRPNRRYLSYGLMLPSTVSDGLNHLVVAVDTSGSIDDDALTRFASEINGAFGDGTIDKITVIYADAAVSHVDEFQRGDIVTFSPAGGGGTMFSPTFRWIAEHAHDASAIIYFTDLFVSDFGEQPSAPVLWAVHGDSRDFGDLASKTPFGEAISLAA